MNYVVLDHPMLSAKSKALFTADSDQFRENHRQAEILLGLDGLLFTAEKADAAGLAIAIQINYQVETGLAYVINKNGPAPVRGGSVYYRGDKDFPTVHPAALQMVDSLMASDQKRRVPVITSLRGPR